MSNEPTSQEEIINVDFEYPEEFQYAIAELAGNIPRIAKGAEGYSINMARSKTNNEIQLSFNIIDKLSKTDKKINIEATSQFLEFGRISELYGVGYDEGTLIFINAGALSNLIEAYIDENPDELGGDILDDLDARFEDVVKTHMSEILTELDAASELAASSKYPISSIAFIEGITAIKSKYNGGSELAVYYSEDVDTRKISMKIECENMEGEDFPDPDHMDTLQDIKDDFDVFKSNALVKISMSEGNSRLIIEANEPMAMLNFIRSCYHEKNIIGGEDAYEAYDTSSAMEYRYSKETVKGVTGDDAIKYHSHLLKAISRKFNRECATVGQDVQSLNKDNWLRFLPMNSYSNDGDAIQMALALSSESSLFSIKSIESRVLQELGQKLPSKHSQFRIH